MSIGESKTVEFQSVRGMFIGESTLECQSVREIFTGESKTVEFQSVWGMVIGESKIVESHCLSRCLSVYPSVHPPSCLLTSLSVRFLTGQYLLNHGTCCSPTCL